MHTRGKMTWAVVYGPGAREPGHLLTTQETRSDALDVIHLPPFDGWDWHLAISGDGQHHLNPR